MSALGQKRTSSRHLLSMSALPPRADIGTQSWIVRFVPKADIGRPAFKPRAAGVAFNQANQDTGAQMSLLWIPLTIALAFLSFSAVAADYPAPKEADWTARDFKFHTGEVCCPSCVCTTPR